jgi:hypothetical protein
MRVSKKKKKMAWGRRKQNTFKKECVGMGEKQSVGDAIILQRIIQQSHNEQTAEVSQ